MKRRRILAFVLTACVLLAACVAMLRVPSGPTHEGRALCYWLTRLDSDDIDESARAYAAVERIGPDSLPTIRRLLALRDSEFKRAVRKTANRLPLGLEVRGPGYWRFRARLALSMMGSDQASRLLPECRSMLHDPDARVREDAVEILGGMLGWAAPALPELEFVLKDPDMNVRRSADIAVGNVKRNMNHVQFRQTQKTQQDAAPNAAPPHR